MPTDESNDFMLTTNDNPYNPFSQFKQWYAFDVLSGYNTCSYLARIVKSSHDLSEIDQTQAIRKGMEEIVKYNLLGIYRIVTPKTFKNRSKYVNLKDNGTKK